MSVVSETGHSLQTNFAVKSACELDRHQPNLLGEEGPCSCPPAVLEAGPLPRVCPQPLGLDAPGLPRLWLGSEVQGPGASSYLAASFAPRGKHHSITQPSPSPVLPQPPVFKPTHSDGCTRLQGSVWRAPCPALLGPDPAHLQLTKHLTDLLRGFQFRTKLCTGIYFFIFYSSLFYFLYFI